MVDEFLHNYINVYLLFISLSLFLGGVIVQGDALNCESKTEGTPSAEEIVLVADVDVLDVKLHASEETSYQAEHGGLAEFGWLVSLGGPSDWVSVPLGKFFLEFSLLLLSKLGSRLLPLGFVLLLLLADTFLLGLVQLLNNLVHHSNISKLVGDIISAVLGVLGKVG